MPVARYFLFIGGILLALIFAIDGFSSPQAVVASQAAYASALSKGMPPTGMRSQSCDARIRRVG